MSSRTALLRLGVVLLGATAIWMGTDALIAGYSHIKHAARAGLILFAVLALWAIITWRTTGLRRPERADARRFAAGALGYLLPTALGLTIVLALGLAHVRPAQSTAHLIGQGLLLLCLVLAYEAIPEELIFRDLVQTSLTTLVGRGWAVVLQAFAFAGWGVVIGAAQTPGRFAYFVVFSLVQGLIRLVGGSVLCTIGFHAAFQLVAQWLMGNSWNGWRLSDPEMWLAGAGTIPAGLFAVLIVWLIVRQRRHLTPASRPAQP